MLDFLSGIYLWVKALHVMAVLAWMAGLFYLPRLYVYHMQIAPVGAEHARFVVMERRLLRAIMNPSMIAAWVFGLVMVLSPPGLGFWTSGWWHVKLLGVVAMTGFHMYLAKARKQFEADQRPGSNVFWRAVNEVPTLLMIVIVIMVIVKPF